MRRFAVNRHMPGISHPARLSCQGSERIAWRGHRRPTWPFLLEQLDRLPIVVVIRPRSRSDLHHHGVGLVDPILKLVN
jgi:hypothetical protein